MNSDRSILQRLEEQGRVVPRVQLSGSEAPTRSATARQRYEVVGEVARGGVGVVYKGRDTDLGRDVAMKMLRDAHMASPEIVQRFVEEAQIGGQLQHPGIVPVYELGVVEGGHPFFAMKLVKGRTLAELLEGRASPSEGRHALLSQFAQACHTMAYAHSRGVIHRDLKPANVMVGAFGEVQVVDWGFAKVLKKGGIADERRALRGATVVATVRSAEDGSASIAGSVMGTPAYMPPEQAMGQVDALTERADVFSLGAILCEILTGKPPYTGTSGEAFAAARQARLDEAFARLDACGADAELTALARACLSPLPKDRPRTARVLAEGIAAHLAGAERRAHEARVRAAQEQVKVDEQRRARRQTLVVAASILFVVLLGGGALLVKGGVDAARQRERASAFDGAVRDATRLQAAGADWAGALSAAERAMGLAGSDPSRRQAARELRDGIASAAAAAGRAAAKAREEAELLARLDEITLRRGDPVDAGRIDAAYAAAMPEADTLRAFDRKAELAARFDAWAWLRRKHVPKGRDWQVVDATARELDRDAWRTAVREASAAGDLARLRAIAVDPATEEQDARSLDLLGLCLGHGGDPDAAVQTLERAVLRYPSDFWIQHHLGQFAGRRVVAGGGPAHAESAIEHLTAAVALRPTSAGAVETLGRALLGQGRLEGAIDLLREAARMDPGYAGGLYSLGRALHAAGDFAGAVEALRKADALEPEQPWIRDALAAAEKRLGGD